MTLSDIINRETNEALNLLAEKLSVTDTTAETHSVVEVSGWQDSDCVEALGTYLVTLRVGIIDQAGRIIYELIGETRDYAQDILRSVDEIVKQPESSNESPENWKATWRNAWIAEGIWHCYMRVAMDSPTLHKWGTIIALDLPHISAKDHGQDVTALYINEDGVVGMSLVETKAYRNDPNGAISDAVKTLKDIEEGKHNTRLRQLVTSFRAVMEDTYKQLLSPSLWKNERALVPNPHYEANEATVNWGRKRTVFSGLSGPVVVMPHAINGYDAFFDEIARTMRIKAEEFANNV